MTRARGSRLTLLVASSLALVFTLLGAVHVFWALGGRLGFVSAIPEVDGRRAFTPAPAATFAVALALFVASALVLGRAGLFSSIAPAALFKWPVLVMAVVFLVRSFNLSTRTREIEAVEGPWTDDRPVNAFQYIGLARDACEP